MRPAETNQPYEYHYIRQRRLADQVVKRRTHVMTGANKKAKLFQCLYM